MLALYRAGRQADALAAYRRVRQLLRDELGAEPGEDLQRLHRAILNRDPELDLPSGPAPPAAARPAAIPRELPAEVAAFTGREAALRSLDGMLEEPASPVVISAIAGTAGVGKTALAVNWAHRVADRFPDGQLYLNLRGYASGPPLRPIDALAALLRSLGTPPEQIPTDETQAVGRYRSQLAGRRVLVVLDNAGSVDQVRPLLPGAPGCLVLITSRDRLAGLVARDGARRITLDVLPPDEAYALLDRLLGAKRVDSERAAAEALAQACANLPLALRIAAASLADHPHRSIADYVFELTGGDRLAMLAVEGDQDSAVHATLDLSYQRIQAEGQRLFRLLGLVPGPDVTPSAAAALAGVAVDEVRPCLSRLASAHLLDEHAPDRYTFHDLLRLYAKRLAETVDPIDLRSVAVSRLFDWYLQVADAAARLLYPQMLRLPMRSTGQAAPPAPFDRASGAVAWLDAERANLVAAIQDAADGGPPPLAWRLADCLRGYFWQSGHAVDWQTSGRAALTAAVNDGDLHGQAAAWLNLASFHDYAAAFSEAIEHFTAANDAAGRAGWPAAQASALGNLGVVHWQLGQLPRAAEFYTEALALNHQMGRLEGQATNHLNLGLLNQERGHLERAQAHTAQALALFRQLGHRNGESNALANLGGVHHDLGRLDDAREALIDALAVDRELGDLSAETGTRDSLAAVELDAGQLTRARVHSRVGLTCGFPPGDRRV